VLEVVLQWLRYVALFKLGLLHLHDMVLLTCTRVQII